MGNIVRDMKLAIRALARRPGFTAVIVLTLAVGIGASTAIYSVVHAVVLSPLPYPDAERLALLWQRAPGAGVDEDWFSPGQYVDITAGGTSFESTALTIGGRAAIMVDGRPERVGYVQVTSGYLPMLGARPLLGRLFLPEDDIGERPRKAVLTQAFWERGFGSDPDVVGRTIDLNGSIMEVVGVLDGPVLLNHEVMPTIRDPGPVDLLLSFPMTEATRLDRGPENYNVLAKLSSGATVQRAQTEMDQVAADMIALGYVPAEMGFKISVVPLLDEVVGEVRSTLYILLGAVGLILLIACANVANLLLSRSTARTLEMGIRCAMGARRTRLLMQLLAESLVLAAAGGVAGVALAFAGVRALHAFQPANLPRLGEVGVDMQVLVFAATVALATSLLFGLAPALRVSRVRPDRSLRDGGRTSSRAGGLKAAVGLPNLLVVVETALSVIVLIGAGLLVRSFMEVQRIDPGFEPGHSMSARVILPPQKYQDSETTRRFYQDLFGDLRAIPGVEVVGGGRILPLGPGISFGRPYIEGVPQDQNVTADFRTATADYFSALGIDVIHGRVFDATDDVEGNTSVIVDRALAERAWPNEDPIGKHVGFADTMTVVGVVENVRQYALETESRPFIYYPYSFTNSRSLYVVARSSLDPTPLAASFAATVEALEPDAILEDVQSMSSRVEGSMAVRRFTMHLLQTFALVALLLAAIGTYGVMSYRVSSAQHDIGMRIALGARHGDIVKLVGGHGLRLTLLGLGAGLAGAAMMGNVMGSLLYGVQTIDGPTFAAVALTLGVVALAASYIPARRATRVDPMEALSRE